MGSGVIAPYFINFLLSNIPFLGSRHFYYKFSDRDNSRVCGDGHYFNYFMRGKRMCEWTYLSHLGFWGWFGFSFAVGSGLGLGLAIFGGFYVKIKNE
jgi:hypothetical protein